MRTSSRVAVNAFSQIVKSAVTIIVVLWTSRVVLTNLGVNDYGIYSIVGGVISVIGFLRISLSSTTQRYLSYYQSHDLVELKCIFNNSLIAQIVMSLCICGVLFGSTNIVFRYLNIPLDRMESAILVYYLMIGSLFANLISIPYVAALISKENIVYTSGIQIIEAILKIPIALSLIWVKYDKLEWYAWLMFIMNILVFLGYFCYCFFNYKECKTFSVRKFQPHLFREMFIFSGWDMYGNACHYTRKQGVAILLNNFFSVSINAAYTIGYQVASQVEFLSVSLMTATKPQIVKAESDGNRNRMLRIAEMSSKASFMMLCIFSIPLLFYFDFILELWLGKVPDYTPLFCVGFLIVTLVNVLTSSLNTVNLAVGHVKTFNVIVNSIRVIFLPLIYFALTFGFSPYGVMILYICSELLCSIGRVIYMHFDIGYSITQYIRNVLLPCLCFLLPNIIMVFLLSKIMPDWGLLVALLCSAAITILTAWRFSLNEEEKNLVLSMINRLKNMIFLL